MGLPGSGKTTLARRVVKILKAKWLNADTVRRKYKNWDFTKKGIVRQVKRMKKLAKMSKKKIVVADFVCPLHIQIKIFKPDFIIWMDTIKISRFDSMNKLFKKPVKYDLRLTKKNLTLNIFKIKSKIKKLNLIDL